MHMLFLACNLTCSLTICFLIGSHFTCVRRSTYTGDEKFALCWNTETQSFGKSRKWIPFYGCWKKHLLNHCFRKNKSLSTFSYKTWTKRAFILKLEIANFQFQIGDFPIYSWEKLNWKSLNLNVLRNPGISRLIWYFRISNLMECTLFQIQIGKSPIWNWK